MTKHISKEARSTKAWPSQPTEGRLYTVFTKTWDFLHYPGSWNSCRSASIREKGVNLFQTTYRECADAYGILQNQKLQIRVNIPCFRWVETSFFLCEVVEKVTRKNSNSVFVRFCSDDNSKTHERIWTWKVRLTIAYCFGAFARNRHLILPWWHWRLGFTLSRFTWLTRADFPCEVKVWNFK